MPTNKKILKKVFPPHPIHNCPKCGKDTRQEYHECFSHLTDCPEGEVLHDEWMVKAFKDGWGDIDKRINDHRDKCAQCARNYFEKIIRTGVHSVKFKTEYEARVLELETVPVQLEQMAGVA